MEQEKLIFTPIIIPMSQPQGKASGPFLPQHSKIGRAFGYAAAGLLIASAACGVAGVGNIVYSDITNPASFPDLGWNLVTGASLPGVFHGIAALGLAHSIDYGAVKMNEGNSFGSIVASTKSKVAAAFDYAAKGSVVVASGLGLAGFDLLGYRTWFAPLAETHLMNNALGAIGAGAAAAVLAVAAKTVAVCADGVAERRKQKAETKAPAP